MGTSGSWEWTLEDEIEGELGVEPGCCEVFRTCCLRSASSARSASIAALEWVKREQNCVIK